jgi:hypothetical protein
MREQISFTENNELRDFLTKMPREKLVDAFLSVIQMSITLQHRPQQLITHLEFVIENYLEMAKEA